MTRIQTIRSRMTTRGAALTGAVVLMLSTGGALAYASGGQENDLGAGGDGTIPGVSAAATPTPSQDDRPRGSTGPEDDGRGQAVSGGGPNDPAPDGQRAIGPRRAAQIALAHVGGGTVTEVEREEEHGRLEWEIDVLKGSQRLDVRVDAGTGTVTRVDTDERDDRDDGPGPDDDGYGDDGHGRHHDGEDDGSHGDDDRDDSDHDDHDDDDDHDEEDAWDDDDQDDGDDEDEDD